MSRDEDAAGQSPQTERLVRFALARAASPSGDTLSAAARSLFDFIGCVIGAGTAPLGWSRDRAGRLAMSAHARDQDDLHLRSMTHPGGVIWSAVTACALEENTAWADAAEAAVAGYEVVVRLGESLGSEHRQQWHTTPVAGVIGAAVACARLLGCDEAAAADAAGHATSIASGSAQAQVELSGTLLVHRGYAASMGVACAQAAFGGVHGNRWGLDQRRGVFAATLPSALESRLSGPTGIEETGFRLKPATGFAHSAMDAALQLGRIDPDTIRRVDVAVSPRAALELASNPAPTSDGEAWWSIEHSVASCLAAGNTDTLRSGLSKDERVLSLARRIALGCGEAGWGARVEVETGDGRTLRAEQDIPHGHGHRQATDEELCEKWEQLTGDDGSALLAGLLTASARQTLAAVIEEGLNEQSRSAWLAIAC